MIQHHGGIFAHAMTPLRGDYHAMRSCVQENRPHLSSTGDRHCVEFVNIRCDDCLRSMIATCESPRVHENLELFSSAVVRRRPRCKKYGGSPIDLGIVIFHEITRAI